MTDTGTAASSSASSASTTLPPSLSHEQSLFDAFRRQSEVDPHRSSIVIKRDERKGRYLATTKKHDAGSLLFTDRALLRVWDDESICLACDERHSVGEVCASYRSLFGSMRTTFQQVPITHSRTGIQRSKIRAVMKWVAMTYAAIHAPSRSTKESREEREKKCTEWILLGLDDGSTYRQQRDADGSIRIEHTPRQPHPDRSLAAQMIHSALPLTYRKHYAAELIDRVISILELNAHELVRDEREMDDDDDDDAEGGMRSRGKKRNDDDESKQPTIRGEAIFPFFAMIEHSCMENCCWTSSNKGEEVRITALRPIHPPTPAAVAHHLPTRCSSRMHFAFHTAAVRGLSQSFERSLQMHPPPTPIDVALAEKQHQTYMEALRTALPGGIIEVQPDEKYPDCNFIEDTALVLNDVLVLTRPGAITRRGEEVAVKSALWDLACFRHRLEIVAPATLDGGDVLFTGRHLFVGESKRTNHHATLQLQAFFHRQHTKPEGEREGDVDSGPPFFPFPFTVHSIPVTAGLHLKSVVSILADGVLLLADSNDAANLIAQSIHAIDPTYTFIRVPDLAASNVLRVHDTLLVQQGFPQSEEIIRRAAAEYGIQHVVTLNMSELIKADGALTCGSLLIPFDSTSTPTTSTPTSTSNHDLPSTPLSISYCPPYLPTFQRRSYLRRSYGFECGCDLCHGEETGLLDLARGFRCMDDQQSSRDGGSASSSSSSSSCCPGVVCPFGDASMDHPGRWCCTRCHRRPSEEVVRRYMQAEKIIQHKLDGTKPGSKDGMTAANADADDGMDILERIQSDPTAAIPFLPLIENLVTCVLAANPYASLHDINSTTADSASASSPSFVPFPQPPSVQFSTVSAFPLLMPMSASKYTAGHDTAATATSTSTPSFALTDEESSAVSLLAPSHFIIHQLLDTLLQLQLQSVLSMPSSQSAPLWDILLACCSLRVRNLRLVSRCPQHWIVARELDRMACMLCLAHRHEPAAWVWNEAYDIHRTVFGDEADATQRAKKRAQKPPKNRQELGM